MVGISVVAENRQHLISMTRTKVDTKIRRSIISRRNADASMAALKSLAVPETVQDSSGQVYRATHRIKMRCVINDASRTFGEEFYVVEELKEYDAILRKNA